MQVNLHSVQSRPFYSLAPPITRLIRTLPYHNLWLNPCSIRATVHSTSDVGDYQTLPCSRLEQGVKLTSSVIIEILIFRPISDCYLRN